MYNFQVTNEPAEELARLLVDSGKGAFDLCGFVSGGSEAMESAIKLARQVGTDSSIYLHIDHLSVVLPRNWSAET